MYSVKRTVSTGDMAITTEVTFRTEGELLSYLHINGIDADMDARSEKVDRFSNVDRSNNSGMNLSDEIPHSEKAEPIITTLDSTTEEAI